LWVCVFRDVLSVWDKYVWLDVVKLLGSIS
jgi:hypothetical protein